MSEQAFKIVQFHPTRKGESTETEWEEFNQYEEPRYCVIDMNGEVLDDAQGYGYKTKQNAARAYTYKTKSKSDKAKRAKLNKQIKTWMKEHKDFCRDLEDAQFRVLKENYGENAKIKSADIKEMWAEYDLNPPFSARDFLRAWNS